MRNLMPLIAVYLLTLCTPVAAAACDQPLLVHVAQRLEPSPAIAGQRAVVVAAVARAVRGCHDSRMLDDDHYQPATWALGSCELDAVALLVNASEEGHFCLGPPPACPRGDHGHSAGTFQVQGWADGRWSADLTDRYERDVVAAAAAAYGNVVEGARSCPDEPLAPYCGGCGRRGARALAHARLARAQQLLAEVEGAP